MLLKQQIIVHQDTMDIPVIIAIVNTEINMSLKVYYGFTKLKPSITKIEMVAVFENDNHNQAKNDKFINSAMIIIHTREQTKDEENDASLSSRTFTKFRYFIDEIPFLGDIEKALYQNFEADSNNVSLEERNQIKEKLRESYYKIFNRKPLRQLQLEL